MNTPARGFTTLLAFLAFPCLAKEPLTLDPGFPPPRYQLLVQDNPDAQRFDRVILSHDDRLLCIRHGGWPNAAGHVDWGGQDVKVESHGRTFRSRDWDFGYCAGDCMTRIPPRGTLKGFVNYEEFGDPKEITALPDKHLAFDTFVHLCIPPSKASARSESKTADSKTAKSLGWGSLTAQSAVNEIDKEKAYRRVLESKLFRTRADCARFTVRSSSRPELALSVYSRRLHRSNPRHAYYVAVTEASKNIHQSLQQNSVSAVDVDRQRAWIPKSAAVALRQLWTKLLAQANPTDAPPDFSVNGEAIELSLDASPTPVSIDEIPVLGKEEAGTLQRLRALLERYCTVERGERPALAEKIKSDARDLSNKL